MLLRMCGEALSHGFPDCGPGSLSSFADMEQKIPFETLSLVGGIRMRVTSISLQSRAPKESKGWSL